ncbi:MAG: sigma factor-like helix-turn-helix DNA-binding protein [Patescibacteria group bacterium]|nr:sigma factor-like helix-turn-helix DNA-binding protein [Patescibacteria group bacterium]
MNINYQKICQDLLKDLPERQKEIILHRFGLLAKTSKRETLESIGQSFGVTRERIRQIEEDGISKIKPKLKRYQKTFQYFTEKLKESGDLRKEEILLSQLGGGKYQPQVFFLLCLGDSFKRYPETKEFYSLWTINPNSLILAQKVINSFYDTLRKINQPISLEKLFLSVRPSLDSKILQSYLEISKIIQKGPQGLFGLKDWPEINPRGVKDKAYLVFKREKRPLHFKEVSNLIGPQALPQTVHNELIKDPRFVLVGRGTYALKEWGYIEGQVKDIIFKILKETQRPLPKEKIIAEVLKQRLVKENTILLNLNNKKYFLRDSQGRYQLNPRAKFGVRTI